MNARLVIPALAAACVSLLSCDRVPTADRNPGRPSFITDGTLDGNAHPAVVLIIMDVAGKPAFRCSGTLIAHPYCPARCPYRVRHAERAG